MGIISRCCCDPYKLTYVSAIFTAVEGVVFGVLNIVLLCMYKCAIKPPDSVALGFDKFWAFYFYDRENCEAKSVASPPWTNATYHFPLDDDERSLTTPYDNFIYQVIYLALHAAWVLTALILIYGNARKKWCYYLPWLLVSTAILVMDIAISAFYITDLVTVTDTGGYKSAMFWVLALYFRLFLIWFMNMSQFASAFNAFCKTRHKRSKQDHQRRKMEKAHAEDVLRTEAATEARVRAQMAEEQAAQARRKIPPPVPKKPAAPSELRPFSYLNPGYRPNDPTDVEGMKANPTQAPDIPVRPLRVPLPKGPYFPDDSYGRTRDLEGFPRRYDSVRDFRTQERHPALRRFSSTRGLPDFPVSKPYVPAPDYDMTLRPQPSASGHNHLPRVNLSPRPSTSTNRIHHRQDPPPHAPTRPRHHGAQTPPPRPREDRDSQKTLYYI